jgi:hypothetical protein
VDRRRVDESSAGDSASSALKNSRKTAHSTARQITHGPAIDAANDTKVRPDAWYANRLVRLETGSSSDALLDKCVAA